jgi:hypothetical protein
LRKLVSDIVLKARRRKRLGIGVVKGAIEAI